MDRRGFLGVCAMAAVATACRSSKDDAAGSASTTTTTTTEAPAVSDSAAAAPALRVGGGVSLSVGQLSRVAFTWATPGTLVCDGSTAAVADWPDLAALLGTTFGGDGTSTFGLPALPAADGTQWLISGQGWSFADGQSAMMGEVRPMVVAPPSGSRLDAEWLPCDGRRLPIKGNEGLYALMGTTFGGDGRTEFALPNLPPTAGMAWRISRRGEFPSTTCDAVTPAVPNTAPLDAFVGAIVPVAYQDTIASGSCGLALCRGQLLKISHWLDLAAVLGTRFGGDGRDSFALPAIAAEGGVTPMIVVNGSFADRS
jgi:microcystin-dependent protein